MPRNPQHFNTQRQYDQPRYRQPPPRRHPPPEEEEEGVDLKDMLETLAVVNESMEVVGDLADEVAELRQLIVLSTLAQTDLYKDDPEMKQKLKTFLDAQVKLMLADAEEDDDTPADQ